MLTSLLYLHSVGMGEKPLLLIPNHQHPRDFDHLLTSTVYSLACLSALACSCGDTWASEIGSVLGGTPRLITTWRPVPRGTNGGVTLIGTLCSLAGSRSGLLHSIVSFRRFFQVRRCAHLDVPDWSGCAGRDCRPCGVSGGLVARGNSAVLGLFHQAEQGGVFPHHPRWWQGRCWENWARVWVGCPGQPCR